MVWVETDRLKLHTTDEITLRTPGRPLTDKHINYAQVLLKQVNITISKNQVLQILYLV